MTHYCYATKFRYLNTHGYLNTSSFYFPELFGKKGIIQVSICTDHQNLILSNNRNALILPHSS
jgi:hypothetical protein